MERTASALSVSHRRGALVLLGVFMAIAVACSNDQTSATGSATPTPPGAQSPSGAATPTQTISEPPFECHPTPRPSGHYGNDEQLATALWSHGTVVFEPDGPGRYSPNGPLAMKWPWWRGTPGAELTIEGRRLDAPAPPLEAEIIDGYDSSFQASTLVFSTPGCWEVTARTPSATLTFVTLVVVRAPPEADYNPVSFVPSRRVVPTRVPPPSVEAANAEAAIWLAEVEPSVATQPAVAQAEGSAEPACVDVTTYDSIRSGGFVLDVADWERGLPNLTLLPAEIDSVFESGYSNPLLVRMRALDGPEATDVIEVRGGASDLGDETIGWELGFGLEPSFASWLVVATAAQNWGCFVIRVEVPGGASGQTIAEIEGSFFPTVSIPPGRETTFGASISGGPFPVPPERRCVEVDGDRTISGDWLLASGGYEERWRPDWQTGERTIFVPLNQSSFEASPDGSPSEPLRLDSFDLDYPRSSYTYIERTGVQAGIRGGGSEGGYVTEFALPHAGRWAVVSTSGSAWNWGCFVLDVG